MTLPVSGTITLAQVNTELGNASTANINLNQASVRSLFGKASGVISLNDGHGKSSYAIGYVSSYGFTNYGSYGTFYLYVSAAQPYSAIGMQFYANTSGQPLGGMQFLGYCDGTGNFSYTPVISNTDPYWYPPPQTNWFQIYQDSTNLGAFAASS